MCYCFHPLYYFFVGLWLGTEHSEQLFVESVYLWFITFTTIGFGDYTPNHTSRSIPRLSKNGLRPQGESFDTEKSPAKIIAAILAAFILGLCFVSAVINSIIAVIKERNVVLVVQETNPGERSYPSRRE